MSGFFVLERNGSGIFWNPYSRFPRYTVAAAIGANWDLSFVFDYILRRSIPLTEIFLPILHP
jgi:hypothetical protein